MTNFIPDHLRHVIQPDANLQGELKRDMYHMRYIKLLSLEKKGHLMTSDEARYQYLLEKIADHYEEHDISNGFLECQNPSCLEAKHLMGMYPDTLNSIKETYPQWRWGGSDTVIPISEKSVRQWIS